MSQLPPKLFAALSDQIAFELAASHMYLQASLFFAELNMPGLAAHYRKDSDSERAHGFSVIDYVLKRGGCKLILDVIPKRTYACTSAINSFHRYLSSRLRLPLFFVVPSCFMLPPSRHHDACGAHACSDAAVQSWSEPVDVAQTVLELELQMTERLNQLLRLARDEGDGGTETFLFPLIANQVTECEGAQSLLTKMKAFADMPGLLYHLDAMVS
jgi:ferritin